MKKVSNSTPNSKKIKIFPEITEADIEILSILIKHGEATKYDLENVYNVPHTNIYRELDDVLLTRGFVEIVKSVKSNRSGRKKTFYDYTSMGLFAFLDFDEDNINKINYRHLISKIKSSYPFRVNKDIAKLITKDFVKGLLKLWLKLAEKNKKINRPSFFHPPQFDFGLSFLCMTIKGVEGAIVEHIHSRSIMSLNIGQLLFSSTLAMDPPNLKHIIKNYGDLKLEESEAIIKYLLAMNFLTVETENILLMDKYIKSAYNNQKDFWIRGYLPLHPLYISIRIEIDQYEIIKALKTGTELKNKIIKQIKIERCYENIDESEFIDAIKIWHRKIINGKVKGEEIFREERKLPHYPLNIISDFEELKKKIKDLKTEV